jgi:hypothetical protein
MQAPQASTRSLTNQDEDVRRSVTLAVEIANDDEYADVIQRAHALQQVIDVQWT